MKQKYWTGILAGALILALAWGINEYRLVGDYRLVMENQNRRALNDLASHLDQLETDMAKSGVATSGSQRVLYLGQMWSQSESAVKDIAQLPAEEVGLSYLNQFLNQIGDFARTSAHKTAAGVKLSEQEEKLLQDMHERLLAISGSVQDLAARVNTGQLDWTDPSPTMLERLGFGKAKQAEAAAEGQEGGTPKSVRSGLESLEADLQKLPPFSYTGEFATKVVDKPLGLPKRQVAQSDAQKIAAGFLHKVGYPDAVPEAAGETQGVFGGYQWKYKDVFFEVSRQGGVITFYRDQRAIQERALSPAEAQKKGLAELKQLGWDLVLTSTEDFGSYLAMEAVAEQDGVRVYPDKVRFMVALDNGQIVGLDPGPYWAYHHDRKLDLTGIISPEQAEARLRQDFKAKERRLALIPKMVNKEVLCYEFRGRFQGEEYLIYLNAKTGSEEMIKRIIHTPRGEYLQ